MERKFTDCSMEAVLQTCKPFPIKCSPFRIVVHKREWGYRYEDTQGETVAIIYYYEGADQQERRSIQLMVIDGITYTMA